MYVSVRARTLLLLRLCKLIFERHLTYLFYNILDKYFPNVQSEEGVVLRSEILRRKHFVVSVIFLFFFKYVAFR